MVDLEKFEVFPDDLSIIWKEERGGYNGIRIGGCEN